MVVLGQLCVWLRITASPLLCGGMLILMRGILLWIAPTHCSFLPPHDHTEQSDDCHEHNHYNDANDDTNFNSIVTVICRSPDTLVVLPYTFHQYIMALGVAVRLARTVIKSRFTSFTFRPKPWNVDIWSHNHITYVENGRRCINMLVMNHVLGAMYGTSLVNWYKYFDSMWHFKTIITMKEYGPNVFFMSLCMLCIHTNYWLSCFLPNAAYMMESSFSMANIIVAIPPIFHVHFVSINMYME